MPACPKPRSRFDEQKEDRALEKANERSVHAQVDARDERTCRVCGCWANTTALSLLQRAHRHHIVYRSAGGEDTSSNLATICAQCHDDEHMHRIRLSGNADERNELGQLAGICVEKETESGWQIVAWV